MVLRGDRLFDDLAALLDGHDLPRGFTTAYPMSANSIKLLHAAPSDTNPVLNDDYHALARSAVGLAGFMCCNVRPDAYFAFVAITQRIAHNFTLQVWKAVLSWTHYLVQTRHQCLTYRSCAGALLFGALSLTLPLPISPTVALLGYHFQLGRRIWSA